MIDRTREKDRKRSARRRAVNAEESRAVGRRHYANHSERVKVNVKKWKQANPHRVRAHSSQRRAALAAEAHSLTPQDKDVITAYYRRAQEISESTGEIWEVDHIVPLQYPGDELRGRRHHPDNLQVVPASWNRQKSNSSTDLYDQPVPLPFSA